MGHATPNNYSTGNRGVQPSQAIEAGREVVESQTAGAFAPPTFLSLDLLYLISSQFDMFTKVKPSCYPAQGDCEAGEDRNITILCRREIFMLIVLFNKLDSGKIHRYSAFV